MISRLATANRGQSRVACKACMTKLSANFELCDIMPPTRITAKMSGRVALHLGEGIMAHRLTRAPRKRVRIILALMILLISATSVVAEIIWRGDFETGTTEQWKGAPQSDSIKVVTEPVREGKYALRIDGT